ncbi:unnamed protein product [Peniophora sp. CBMAI 1063]|nr:unnamed protein product [Peniophora sp. CBMAI 1063]
MADTIVHGDDSASDTLTNGDVAQVPVLLTLIHDIIACGHRGLVSIIITVYGIVRSAFMAAFALFRDVFSGDQTAFEFETQDGVPVLELPDNHDDAGHLSMMVTHGWYLQELKTPFSEPGRGLWRIPPAYYELLALTRTHQFLPGHMAQIFDAFHELWPTDLGSYLTKETVQQQRVDESAPPALTAGLHPASEWDQTKLWADPVEAFAVALEHEGLHDILAVLAYVMVRSPTEDTPLFKGGFRRINLDLLDEEYRSNIQAGADILRLECIRKMSWVTFTRITLRAERCENTPGAKSVGDLQCYNGIEKFWEKHVDPLFASAKQPIDLSKFPSTKTIYRNLPEVCDRCVSAVETHIHNTQFVLWTQFPLYFGLTKYTSPEWGFDTKAARVRLEALPQQWKDEVRTMSAIAREPDAGLRASKWQELYEEKRVGPCP